MDASSFDQFTRLSAQGTARRTVLRSGVAVILAGLGIASFLGTEEAAAKSCKRKCKKKKSKQARKKCLRKCNKCKRAEANCQTSQECCPGKTNRICAISHNSGLNTVCCGTTGAACASTFQCCLDYVCDDPTSTCVPQNNL